VSRKRTLRYALTTIAEALLIIIPLPMLSLIKLCLINVSQYCAEVAFVIAYYYFICHYFVSTRKLNSSTLSFLYLYSVFLFVYCLFSAFGLHFILIGNMLNIFARPRLSLPLIILQNTSIDVIVTIAALAAIATMVLTSIRRTSLQRVLHALAPLLEMLLKVTLLLIVGATAIAIALYAIVNAEYPKKAEALRNSIGDKCLLDKAWDLVKYYKGDFISTYGTIWPKPRQLIIRFGPLTLEPSRVFAAKLAAVSGTGACEDFALGATQLLSDVLGCEARVVAFLGEDHALPEVKVGDTWYVVDVTYTTPKSPVKVSEYAEHLRATRYSLYSKAKGVIEAYTGRDLSAEHGFAATDG